MIKSESESESENFLWYLLFILWSISLSLSVNRPLKFIQNFLSIDNYNTVKLFTEPTSQNFLNFRQGAKPHCSVDSGTVNIFDMTCSAEELHFRRPNEFTLANRMISLKSRKALSHAARDLSFSVYCYREFWLSIVYCSVINFCL